MRKKKFVPEVLWSMDLNYNCQEGTCKYTLYDIIQENSLYIVRYHGVCKMYTGNTVEQCKSFVISHVNKWIGMAWSPYDKKRNRVSC